MRLVRGGERSAGTGVPYKYFGGRRWTRTWWIESYEVESQGYQPKPTFSLFKSTQAFIYDIIRSSEPVLGSKYSKKKTIVPPYLTCPVRYIIHRRNIKNPDSRGVQYFQ